MIESRQHFVLYTLALGLELVEYLAAETFTCGATPVTTKRIIARSLVCFATCSQPSVAAGAEDGRGSVTLLRLVGSVVHGGAVPDASRCRALARFDGGRLRGTVRAACPAMLNIQSIQPHMPVVCSEGGQFATVDHLEGSSSIKLARDTAGQHHYIPVSWVTRVDDKVHVDRPGAAAMQQWTTEADEPRLPRKDPSWWTDEHSSAWDRTKQALRRDWEQTKADVSSSGHELNQSLGDTLKQATGKEAIPPGNVPNLGSGSGWADEEPALRYGYGARQYYAGAGEEWDDELEGKLKNDWDSTSNDSSWDRVKGAVRRGWESVKRAVD